MKYFLVRGYSSARWVQSYVRKVESGGKIRSSATIDFPVEQASFSKFGDLFFFSPRTWGNWLVDATKPNWPRTISQQLAGGILDPEWSMENWIGNLLVLEVFDWTHPRFLSFFFNDSREEKSTDILPRKKILESIWAKIPPFLSANLRFPSFVPSVPECFTRRSKNRTFDNCSRNALGNKDCTRIFTAQQQYIPLKIESNYKNSHEKSRPK